MTFAICSLVLGDEYKEKVKLCTESQRKYIEKNEYKMITDETVYDSSRAHSWSKIPLLQKYMKDYDYLIWIDADVMIMNDERRIEDFIKLLQNDKFLLIGRDFNNLNAGIFVIRNCPESIQFLDEVWSKTEYLNHEWWEQAAIIELYHSKYSDQIQVIPHEHVSIMNAYDQRVDSKVFWRPGDFCVHFAGIHDKELLKKFQILYSMNTSNDQSGSERIREYTKKKMVIDTFMFYNELGVLELRLTVLDKFVDLFVIVESEVNHIGGKKELFFQKNKERFSQWIHKIKHVVVTAEESPKDENPWSREKYQRSCILRGLENVPNNAIVMVSDVDEIPNLNKSLPSKPVVSFHMWMFEYSFEYLHTGEPWFGTVMTNCELFKRMGPNYFRDSRWKFPVVQYAGWHLSSFGNAAHVANKHQTFAHAKDKRDIEMTTETFEKLIFHGIHTDGKTQLKKRTSDIQLPAPVETLIRLGLVGR